jgi:hypothetical protein
MFVFFLWVMWFALLFRVIVDVFRDEAMSGWAKACWLVVCTFVPFLGVFVYVLVRGKDMGRREREQARAQREELRAYFADDAGSGRRSSVDELARLSEIRAKGDITDEEFRRAKELVLSGQGPAAPGSSSGTAPGSRAT